jgi:hypothetical protein
LEIVNTVNTVNTVSTVNTVNTVSTVNTVNTVSTAVPLPSNLYLIDSLFCLKDLSKDVCTNIVIEHKFTSPPLDLSSFEVECLRELIIRPKLENALKNQADLYTLGYKIVDIEPGNIDHVRAFYSSSYCEKLTNLLYLTFQSYRDLIRYLPELHAT